ncbi:Olfactory receptor 6C75 [Lemmus lemmus]
MKNGSLSLCTEFTLVAFSSLAELQLVLFFVFLVIYLFTVGGNLLIICVIWAIPSLHTPMYFFLVNLSFLEMCYISSVVPQMLVHLLVKSKTISVGCCAAQMYVFTILGLTECCLLAAMAYDRFVAICYPLHYTPICKPLHYMTIMNKKVCVQLVLSCWLAGFLVIFPPLLLGLNLDFCASNIVDHFYCDTTPLMQLSCRHTALGDDGLCLGFGDTLSHIGNGDNFLHLHCHDDSKNPFNQPEKESFLYVLFSHDCDIPFVWQLHLHVC